MTCFPVEQAVAEFHTSGTTAEKSGKHFFKTLGIYDAAIRPNFAAHLLVARASRPFAPIKRRQRARRPFYILAFADSDAFAR